MAEYINLPKNRRVSPRPTFPGVFPVGVPENPHGGGAPLPGEIMPSREGPPGGASRRDYALHGRPSREALRGIMPPHEGLAGEIVTYAPEVSGGSAPMAPRRTGRRMGPLLVD